MRFSKLLGGSREGFVGLELRMEGGDASLFVVQVFGF
jgi:hypothetical protein